MLHNMIIGMLIIIIVAMAVLWYLQTQKQHKKHKKSMESLLTNVDENDDHIKNMMTSNDPYHACEMLLYDIQKLSDDKKLLELELSERKKEQTKIAAGLDKTSHEIIHISHQMRTSLSGLLGFTHFLESTELNDEQAEFVAIIAASSDELLSLVNSIIEMTPQSMSTTKGTRRKRNKNKIPYVLVVDDNNINKKLLAKVLENENLNVTYASNGKEAVDLRKEYNFDIIFMDIQMPVMNGVDASKAIRQFENIENKDSVPIIALTGNTSAEDKESYINAGMTDYLSKPIMIDEVRKRIAELK